MNAQCHNCGKIVALKASITTEFTVTEEFRKEHYDAPEKVYLCIKCGNTSAMLESYKQAPWYGGHKVI